MPTTLSLAHRWKSALRGLAVFSAIATITGLGCQDAATNVPLVIVDPAVISRRGGLEFIDGWELGQRIAAERQSLRLVFFTAHWCTYCRQMEATTFADPTVSELGQNFVCVVVDADREPAVCRRFQVSGYPTLAVLAADGAPLAQLRGWQSAPQLVATLRASLQRSAFLEASLLR